MRGGPAGFRDVQFARVCLPSVGSVWVYGDAGRVQLGLVTHLKGAWVVFWMVVFGSLVV